MSIEERERKYIGRHVGLGNFILFTGAGFSLDAKSISSRPIPTVAELKRTLWEFAFPTEPYDEWSTIQDIYDVAMTRGGNAAKSALREALTVNSAGLPKIYQSWFSVPWYRHYTVNVDDLDECVGRAFVLPRRIRSVSALTESMGQYGSDLLSVHLNGRIADLPNVTFSTTEFGQRTARPDEWYSTLSADILSRPVLYVGSQLDEPSLWQHIELRRSRDPRTREMRPRSFLVTPSLPRARVEMLKQYNIVWIQMGQEEFAASILDHLPSEVEAGHKALAVFFGPSGGRNLRTCAEVRSSPRPADAASYLLGREPTPWDIVDGHAIVRNFDHLLATAVTDSTARCVLVTGTAGCGKSSSLLRLALDLDASGANVAFIDGQLEGSPRQVLSEVASVGPDWLFVDDALSFGKMSGRLVAEVLEECPGTRVVAAVRGTRADSFLESARFEEGQYIEVPVPHLVDSDIDDLIAALGRARRLGKLAAKTLDEQREAFRLRAGRQLIVALIEATSGERFEDKLAQECDELDSDSAFLYAAAAVATALRHHVTKEELLLCHGSPRNRTIHQIDALVKRGLLVEDKGGLRVRHRLVATQAQDYFADSGRIGDPLRGLIFALASKVDRQLRRSAREWKLFIGLISHAFLRRVLLDDEGEIRRTYASVEDLLSWDHHFWLQRGSFEVERGDMSLAKNFLEQAKALAPDDYRVQTEWAYFSLKRASSDPSRVGAHDVVEEALRELEDVIRRRGSNDSYPFHVYGSQGLRWARRATMDSRQKISLLDRLRKVVGDGLKQHPSSADLQQLGEDLDREYLGMAVSH